MVAGVDVLFGRGERDSKYVVVAAALHETLHTTKLLQLVFGQRLSFQFDSSGRTTTPSETLTRDYRFDARASGCALSHVSLSWSRSTAAYRCVVDSEACPSIS